jgi:shikimate kinase
MRSAEAIRLVGPGGAGKSTIGALLAKRLDIPFVDLDLEFAARVGDISDYIRRNGYDLYARENIETYCLYCLRCRGRVGSRVIALSSGFMTYVPDVHPEYSRVRRAVETCPNTFVLLPSIDRDVCIAETVRRQVARPFARSALQEETVIQARFQIHMAVPVPKIETMRPAAVIVDEIVAALCAYRRTVPND